MKQYEFAGIRSELIIEYYDEKDIYKTYYKVFCQNTPDYLDELFFENSIVKNRKNWELSCFPCDIIGSLGFEIKSTTSYSYNSGDKKIICTEYVFQREIVVKSGKVCSKNIT